MVQSFVAGILQTNTTAHWMRAIGESGVPVAEIRTVPEVIEDEQLKLRGVFESLPSRIDDEKTVTVVKAGYVTNKDGPTIRSGPPLVGEHTEEILANIGYSRHEIEDWRSRGVI
jgi:crotonobetainyl-CoA:carnitine CoA-transferase CaiB-like acyl-CoA transferase